MKMDPANFSADSNSKLPLIFKDTIILDWYFHISGISEDIVDLLSFSREELKGKNIGILLRTEDLTKLLTDMVMPGFFPEKSTVLFDKEDKEVNVGISGFVSHAVCGIGGFIILKVRNLAEAKSYQEQLQQKKEELDQFIYSIAHDLRGPLATIKGLINLLKIKGGDEEFERLHQLLHAHSNKLDDRLFKLAYLTQADSVKSQPDYVVNFNTLETNLRRIIEQNAFVDFLEFHFSSTQTTLAGVNEALLESLLDNLMLFVLSLPMNDINAHLSLGFKVDCKNLKIMLSVQGFEISELIQKGIKEQGFIYTDMANYPQLMNFYAAQKIGWQLKARIKMEFPSIGKHRLEISVPFANTL